MKEAFKFIVQSRQIFVELIDSLTLEQLNETPEGFNNNIIWNFGHIVVSTQVLCYLRTGINTDPAAIKYMQAYAKGTKPSYTVTQAEVDELKTLAFSTITQLEKDYYAGVFQHIESLDTHTYKTVMTRIEEVILMSSGHDNMHLGYAMAQKRVINTNK